MQGEGGTLYGAVQLSYNIGKLARVNRIKMAEFSFPPISAGETAGRRDFDWWNCDLLTPIVSRCSWSAALQKERLMESTLNTTDTKGSKVKSLPFVHFVPFVFNSWS